MVGEPVSNLEPRVAEVTPVRPVIGVRCLEKKDLRHLRVKCWKCETWIPVNTDLVLSFPKMQSINLILYKFFQIKPFITHLTIKLFFLVGNVENVFYRYRYYGTCLKYKFYFMQLYYFTLNLCSTNFSHFILSNLKFYHSFNWEQLSQRCEKLHCHIEDPDHFDDDLDQAFTVQIRILAYDANPDDVKCYGSGSGKMMIIWYR